MFKPLPAYQYKTTQGIFSTGSAQHPRGSAVLLPVLASPHLTSHLASYNLKPTVLFIIQSQSCIATGGLPLEHERDQGTRIVDQRIHDIL